MKHQFSIGIARIAQKEQNPPRDTVELNFIKSTCIFFSFMFFDCAIIFLFFDIIFVFSSIILQTICLNNSKEISSNLRKRISINVFNICLIISTEFDYFLIICINFSNSFEISTTSTELILINFVFLYLTAREFELMLTKIFFIATSLLKTLIDFKSLLKTTLFVKFTVFEQFSL